MRILADDYAAKSFIQDFDLSRNKSLRTLEVTAHSIYSALRIGSPDTASNLLEHALSTVTSPVFSEVIVFFQDCDFRAVQSDIDCNPLRGLSLAESAEEDSRYRRQFEVYHNMRAARPFQLVMCASVWNGVGEYTVQTLKQAAVVEMRRRPFGNPFPDPLVIYYPKGSRPHYSDRSGGWGVTDEQMPRCYRS